MPLHLLITNLGRSPCCHLVGNSQELCPACSSNSIAVGFGKTIAHNFTLLRELSAFKMLDKPIMAGLSRKSTIYKTLGVTAEEALNGTTVLNTLALQNGANILRVHDVKEAKEVVTLWERYIQPL